MSDTMQEYYDTIFTEFAWSFNPGETMEFAACVEA